MPGVKGRSGARPTPTRIKLLRGTQRKDRANPQEPVLTPCLPEPPADLEDDERAAYREIGARVLAMGVMTAADVDALALLACTRERWKRLKAEVRKSGETRTGEKGESRAPAATALDVVTRQLSAQYAAFGLDPSGRARVKVAPAPAAETEEDRQARRFFGA